MSRSADEMVLNFSLLSYYFADEFYYFRLLLAFSSYHLLSKVVFFCHITGDMDRQRVDAKI